MRLDTSLHSIRNACYTRAKDSETGIFDIRFLLKKHYLLTADKDGEKVNSTFHYLFLIDKMF